MKRFIHFVTLLLMSVFVLFSCQRENPSPEENNVVPRSTAKLIKMNIGTGADSDEDTKSLISTTVEDIVRNLAIVCINPSSGQVYRDAQNVAYEIHNVVPDKSGDNTYTVEMEIPPTQAVKFYVLLNYDNSLFPSDANLNRTNLENMLFTCSSQSAFTSLETSNLGLPYAGTTSIAANSSRDYLSLPVKCLFARYDLYFDLSQLSAMGWSGLLANHINVYNCATKCYYFKEAYTFPTSGSGAQVWSQIERASSIDLDIIQQGGSANPISLYVLENYCVSPSFSVNNWKDAALPSNQSTLGKATNLSVSVRCIDDNTSEYKESNLNVYLSNAHDFKSDFNVYRNQHRVLALVMPTVDNAHPDITFDKSQSKITPLETTTQLKFYTKNVTKDEVRFTRDNNNVTLVYDKTTFVSDNSMAGYDHSGYVSVTPHAASTSYESYHVIGTATHNGYNAESNVQCFIPTVLSASWITEPSYIGCDCQFRLIGLNSGETISSIDVWDNSFSSKYTHNVVSYSGDVVTFAPGKEAQRVVVTTSTGRTFTQTVSGVKRLQIKVNYPDSQIALSIDGTWVYPRISFRYGTSDLTSQINSKFKSDYLSKFDGAVTNTVTNLFGYANNNYRGAGYSSDNNDYFAVYTKVINNILPEAWGTNAGSVTISRKSTYDVDVDSGTINLFLPDSRLSSSQQTDFGTYHDFSLIPASGTISSSYLSSKGYSVSNTSSLPSSVSIAQIANTVSSSAIKGISLSTDASFTITNFSVNGGTCSFTTNFDSKQIPGVLSYYVNVENSNTYTVCKILVGTLKIHKHLAIAGVRSSLKSSGNNTYYFTAIAQFVSNYQGSESTRYQDWPTSLKNFKDTFKHNGIRHYCVMPGYAYDQQGGVVYRELTYDSDASGVGSPLLYQMTYRPTGTNTTDRLYSNEVSMHQFYTYVSSSTLGTATDVLNDGTYIHIHDYKKLYPSSNGWATAGSNTESFTF